MVWLVGIYQSFQTLTDVVAFNGTEHAEGLNQPAAVLQKAVQVGTRTELTVETERALIEGTLSVLKAAGFHLFLHIAELLHCAVTHRKQVLHGDHKAGVSNEPVPQSQDVSHRLHQHAAAEQHEVETGHQVAQAEDVDASGAGDEDEAEHQPEEIAEHKHLHHVKVASEDQTEVLTTRKGNIL